MLNNAAETASSVNREVALHVESRVTCLCSCSFRERHDQTSRVVQDCHFPTVTAFERVAKTLR